jgi:hypothetical protein
MCDDRAAVEGEACMSPNGARSCTADGAHGLVCSGGHWSAWRACKGPRGCVAASDHVECDSTLADVGDPCVSPDSFACSRVGAALLACVGEHMEVARRCRGVRECRVDEGSRKTDCDDSVAREGDECGPDGVAACSEDRAFELVCAAGRFARGRACTRPGACAPQGGARPLCVEERRDAKAEERDAARAR